MSVDSRRWCRAPTACTHYARDLASLCAGYDDLAARIESGHRLLPGM
ncbi:hypothetical protein [Nocardia wallacei]|nr:hypothetical protein [Nocardia wallacei]